MKKWSVRGNHDLNFVFYVKGSSRKNVVLKLKKILKVLEKSSGIFIHPVKKKK